MLPRQQLPRIYKLFWWQQNCFYCKLLRTCLHITPRRTGASGSHRHTRDKQGKNASFCEQNHPDGHSSSPKDSPNLPSTSFFGGGASSWHLLPEICTLVLDRRGWGHAYCELTATSGHGCPWLDRGWQPLLRSHILAHAGTNTLPAGNEAE